MEGMGRQSFPRDTQYYKFCAYGFLKNLRFFEPFLLLFFLEQGISLLQAATLIATREVAINLLEIPTGAIADGLGRRRTMAASFAAYLFSFLLFLLGRTMGMLVAATLLFSFGEAFRTGTHKAMIFTHLRLRGLENLGNAYYGHTRGCSQIGSAISSLLAAAIVFVARAYRSVFLFSLVPYLLDLILVLSYPRELDGDTEPISPTALRRRWKVLREGLRETVRSPGAVRAVIGSAALGGFYKGSRDFLQPLLSILALSLPVLGTLSARRREAMLIGIVYAAIYLLTSVAARRSAAAAERLGGRERALNLLYLAGLATILVAGISRWYGGTVLPAMVLPMLFVLHNLRHPSGIAVVADRVPEPVLATVLSVQSQLQSLLAAVVALVIGVAADATGGNLGAGLLSAGAIGLGLTPIVWLTARASGPPRSRG